MSKVRGLPQIDPCQPAYEEARQRVAAILREIGKEDPRNGYTEMAHDLLEGQLMQLPTWIALALLSGDPA